MIVSARAVESFDVTASITGRKIIASARAKSFARRWNDLLTKDRSESRDEGRKPGNSTPEPSLMSSHGAMSAVFGEP